MELKDQGDGSTERRGTCHLDTKQVDVEEVQSMSYLGAMRNEEGSCVWWQEKRCMIGAASGTAWALRTEINAKN